MNFRPNWSQASTVAIWLLLGAAIGGASMWFAVRGARPEPPKPVVDPLTAAPTQFDWAAAPAPEFPFPPYARYLDHVSIVLDPGHGGHPERKNWKRGPTGLREAEVNLRVAQFLRDFLVAAGAKVVMTRDADIYLDEDTQADLRRRVQIANDREADLFLSLHHNGVDHSPAANYTSVFYHATPEYSPASMDAARCLLTGLMGALRLEQQLECGLVSDYAVYPNRGFAVLRQAKVPAVLVEASFFSNPDEENRLRDPVYNRREAYGLFLGLARWAYGGLPSVELLDSPDTEGARSDDLRVALHDGLAARRGFGSSLPQIREASIVVEINGAATPFSFDPKTNQLTIPRPSAGTRPGREKLHVDFANTFGQHVLHPWIALSAR